MTIHVCDSDGQRIGEFEEEEFRNKIFAGFFPADTFYWHEGMPDWKPIAGYRALAKTQRIKFTPPMVRTIKIEMDAGATASAKPAARGAERFLSRWWHRMTRPTKPKVI